MNNVLSKIDILIKKGTIPSFIILKSISDEEALSTARSIAQTLFGKKILEQNTDYIELCKDAFTIHDIRELQARMSLTSHSRYNICVLHKLEQASALVQSALLKITEDVPKNTIFIVTTISPRKIIPTLLSRAFQLSVYSQHDTKNSKQDDSKEDLPRLDEGKAGLLGSALRTARINLVNAVKNGTEPNRELKIVETLLQIKENAESPVISDAAILEIVPLLK